MQIQPTFDNFRVLCSLYDVSVQMDVIRRTYDVPEHIRGTHSSNGAADGLCIHMQDLCVREGIRTHERQVRGWLRSMADLQRRNPVREYLEQQSQRYQIPPEQRGEACMQVFSCLHFAEDVTDEQRDQYANLFLKWLLQCVAMAHNEMGEYGADFVLVLQSRRQGTGKTSFFRQLCSPKPLRPYFLEGRAMDPSNKDDVLQNTACWICELGELEGTTRKRDVDRLKAFLTNRLDRIRAPYDAAACDYPRLTCYAGTVNEPDFLREAGRRFVILPIAEVDLPQLRKVDMNRMWAEVYDAYRTDPNAFRLTREEMRSVVANSSRFRSVYTEEQVIRDLLQWDSDPKTWQEHSATEIARALDIRRVNRVSSALRNLGYEKTKDPNVARRYRIINGVLRYRVPARKAFIPQDLQYQREEM